MNTLAQVPDAIVRAGLGPALEIALVEPVQRNTALDTEISLLTLLA